MSAIVPPEIASELSSRLLALDGRLRQVFAANEVTFSGGELEQILGAAFLAGYGDGIREAVSDGPLSGLADAAARLAGQVTP